jgi:hypothetical protein
MGGTALVRVGEADACIAHRVGKGWAIYLNMLFDKYAKQRSQKFGGAGYRSLLNALLARVSVRPAIEVLSADGKRLTQAQVTRYRFGDTEILAIVKDNVAVEGIRGQDGVTTYTDAGLGQVARQEITVKLPRRLYVTDARNGKQLGSTSVIHSSVIVGDAAVFGLSPTQNTITLRGAAAAPLGAHPAFNITSQTPGRRLIRCHVFAPDHSMLPAYSSNVLLEGAAATIVLPTALNDPAGVYTLRATDVVTGATTEAKITLK